jgi:hypothetical protein
MGSLCDSRKQVNNFNISDQICYIDEEEENLRNIRRGKNSIEDLEKDMRINQVKSMFFILSIYLNKESCNLNDLAKEDYSKLMAPKLYRVWDLYEEIRTSNFNIKPIETFKKEILVLTGQNK